MKLQNAYGRVAGSTALGSLLAVGLASGAASPAFATSTCNATANTPTKLSSPVISWSGSGDCGPNTTSVQGELDRQGTLKWVAIDSQIRYSAGSVGGGGSCNGATSTYHTYVVAQSTIEQIAITKTSTSRSITC